MSYANSLQSSYEKVFSNPFTLIVYIFVFVVFISELYTTRNPLDVFILKLQTYISNHPTASIFKSLAQLFLKLFETLSSHKSEVVALGLYIIPLILNFSLYGLFSSLVFSLLSYSLITDPICSFLIANVILLYFIQEDSADKVITLVIFSGVFFLWLYE